MDDEQQQAEDKYAGVKWFAGLVNAYAGALDGYHIDGRLHGALVADFQSRILAELLEEESVLMIIDHQRYLQNLEHQERKEAIKLAEREAALKAGG